MSSVSLVVLTMVGDPDAAAGIDRVAAAVGARATATENPSRRAWLGAAAIVVDERNALLCARLGLPRRDGVVLVSPGEAPKWSTFSLRSIPDTRAGPPAPDSVRTWSAVSATAAAERAGVLIAGPLGLCFLPAFVCLGVVPVVAGLAGDVFGPGLL